MLTTSRKGAIDNVANRRCPCWRLSQVAIENFPCWDILERYDRPLLFSTLAPYILVARATGWAIGVREVIACDGHIWAECRRTMPLEISRSEIFVRPELILGSAAEHER